MVEVVDVDEPSDVERCELQHACGPGLVELAAKLGVRGRTTSSYSRETVKRVASAVAGLTTRTGTRRSERILGCARWRPAVSGLGTGSELGGYVLTRCRDRVCPRCAEHRSIVEGARIRDVWASRSSAGRTILFVTLTQVKMHTSVEGPREAIDRALATWRRVSNKKYAGARLLNIVGGARSVEITWSPAGERIGRNGQPFTVAFDGWHAHLHMLVEVEGDPGAFAASLIGAWLKASPGARPGEQEIRKATERNVGQIAKYSLKPFELFMPSLLAAAAEAMAKRKLYMSFGTWRAAKKQASERKREPLVVFKDVSFGDFMHALRKRGNIITTRYVGGELGVDSFPAQKIAAGMLAWGMPLGDAVRSRADEHRRRDVPAAERNLPARRRLMTVDDALARAFEDSS